MKRIGVCQFAPVALKKNLVADKLIRARDMSFADLQDDEAHEVFIPHKELLHPLGQPAQQQVGLFHLAASTE